MVVNALLIFVLAHLVFGLILWLRVRKLYSYPGLLGFPVFGNLFYFYKTLFMGSLESLRIHIYKIAKQYGKNGICFHYLYGFKKMLIVTDPQVIKQIGCHPKLKDKPAYLFEGLKAYIDGPFSRPHTDDIWKMKRKEYNYLLRKSRIENNFYDVFLKSANNLVELMFTSRSALNIHPAITGVTQSVTMETIFGLECTIAQHPEIIHFVEFILGKGSLMIANPKITEAMMSVLRPIDELWFRKLGTLRRTILKEIYKKMNNIQLLPSGYSEPYQSLPMYIASRTEKNKKFNRRVINELQEVFISSTHTVSSVTSFSITCLAVLPELQERAWKEQHEIFGEDTREPTSKDLEQMKFLESFSRTLKSLLDMFESGNIVYNVSCVKRKMYYNKIIDLNQRGYKIIWFIKESLRFSSPPFIAKHAAEDIELDGTVIPKGTIVIYAMEFIRKDPNYWKNPEIFNPDRFLEENEQLKYLLAPFGIGARSCPGVNFAMTLMKIHLSKVLRRTKISPVKKNIKFEDFEFESQIMMELKNPPLLQVEERF